MADLNTLSNLKNFTTKNTVFLCSGFKEKIVQEVEQGMSFAAVASKYGIPESLVSCWCKNTPTSVTTQNQQNVNFNSCNIFPSQDNSCASYTLTWTDNGMDVDVIPSAPDVGVERFRRKINKKTMGTRNYGVSQISDQVKLLKILEIQQIGKSLESVALEMNCSVHTVKEWVSQKHELENNVGRILSQKDPSQIRVTHLPTTEPKKVSEIPRHNNSETIQNAKHLTLRDLNSVRFSSATNLCKTNLTPPTESTLPDATVDIFSQQKPSKTTFVCHQKISTTTSKTFETIRPLPSLLAVNDSPMSNMESQNASTTTIVNSVSATTDLQLPLNNEILPRSRTTVQPSVEIGCISNFEAGKMTIKEIGKESTASVQSIQNWDVSKHQNAPRSRVICMREAKRAQFEEIKQTRKSYKTTAIKVAVENANRYIKIKSKLSDKVDESSTNENSKDDLEKRLPKQTISNMHLLTPNGSSDSSTTNFDESFIANSELGSSPTYCSQLLTHEEISRRPLLTPAKKLELIAKIEAGELTIKEAAKKTGFSPITVWRWKQSQPIYKKQALQKYPVRKFKLTDEAKLDKLKEIEVNGKSIPIAAAEIGRSINTIETWIKNKKSIMARVKKRFGCKNFDVNVCGPKNDELPPWPDNLQSVNFQPSDLEQSDSHVPPDLLEHATIFDASELAALGIIPLKEKQQGLVGSLGVNQAMDTKTTSDLRAKYLALENPANLPLASGLDHVSKTKTMDNKMLVSSKSTDKSSNGGKPLKIITPQQKLQFIEKMEAGELSVEQVAQLCNRKADTVKQWKRSKHVCASIINQEIRFQYSDEVKLEKIRDIENGKSIEDVANELSRRRETIQRWFWNKEKIIQNISSCTPTKKSRFSNDTTPRVNRQRRFRTRYFCIHCWKRFDSVEECSSHIKSQHQKCSYCLSGINKNMKNLIVVSTAKHHCPKPGCIVTTREYTALVRHVESSHPDDKFVLRQECEKCLVDIPSMYVVRHKAHCSNARIKRECRICGRTYRVSSSYVRHSRVCKAKAVLTDTSRHEIPLVCSKCDMKFYCVFSYQIHLATH